MTFKKLEQDLEFDQIKQRVAAYCQTQSAAQHIFKSRMMKDFSTLKAELECVNEFRLSFEQVQIPGFKSDEIAKEVHLLGVGGSTLPAESFMALASLCENVAYVCSFLKKHHEMYPALAQRIAYVVPQNEVRLFVLQILDEHGQVKSSASKLLAEIRSRLGNLRKQSERNFLNELAKYRQAGWLDDTKESFVNGRRVLAVLSEYKRKVKGTLVSSSATGKLSFMEPAENVALNNEITFQEQEERNEILRILKELTERIRVFLPSIQTWQKAIVDFDALQAKARFALETNSRMPILHRKPVLQLKKAYHPLLLIENRKSNCETLPQSIALDKKQRIIVISGPNAGGKSITLKTVGLLCLMNQCGFLIPVEEGSSLGMFKRVLTDIGDNQSIENKLSTYSYRLKTMKYFLDFCDANSLFLIDEFGTGSDPDLGGALAEVFFEELYNSGAFGVITTHYANIKIIADQSPEAVNACMLFNEETYEPLYALSVGQPGSSFTFEVAEKNEIPKDLIHRAKKRVSSGKLRLDDSITRLQSEKHKMEEQVVRMQQAEQKALKQKDDFAFRQSELEEKLLRLQEVQFQNNEFIALGKKFQDLINAYNGKNKKDITARFAKLLQVKKVKSNEPKPEIKLNTIEKEKAKLAEKPALPQKPLKPLKAGDKVVIDQGKETGQIIEIKGNKAIVLFGMMKTSVELNRLMLPPKKKSEKEPSKY